MAADDPRPARRVAPEHAHLVEERIDSEQVFRGRLLDVRRDTVRLPDGHAATREYIVHPGAVLVVPRLPDGRLVVVRQFRYANNAVFLEFPAGKLDHGETALATAQRELREEAGYTAATWSRLGLVHTVVAYSTEAIELFLADDLTHVGGQALDHGEFVDVDAMTCADVVAAAERGEITDVKTVAALWYLSRRIAP
jgi:ADP-ribose pyrophosphatase